MNATAVRAGDDSTRRIIAHAALLAVAYFLGAKLGLRLAFSNENVTSVWPPTGIALAGLLIFGPRVWPGIAVGALAANLSNGASLATSLGIMVGNTLGPIVGASLLRRVGFRNALDRLRDVFALVVLGGLSSMLISATGGTATLAATDAIGRDGAGLAWLVWWIGDALGVILFAPVILTFATPADGPEPLRERPREAALLAAGAAIAAIIVFNTTISLAHLLYVFAIWAGARFRQRGAAAMIVLISGIAIAETVNGHGPFTGMSRTTNLLSLQAFNGAAAIVALSIAAVIRERAKAQHDLQRSRQLDEFKDSLLTAVSHELRTPLTVIMGLATTLTDHDVDLTPREERELIERLEANAHRLDRLLADLLDVDRLKRGIIEPRPRAIRLGPLVQRVMAELEMKEHEILVDVGAARVAADPAHVERIVENLLANATKHTPPNTTVRVRTEQIPEGVVMIIEDDGPGIAAHMREEIFEPFRRGDLESHAAGTGIGLSLVARFAGVNGGRAWVEERQGGGASFRVLLPAALSTDGEAAGAPRPEVVRGSQNV